VIERSKIELYEYQSRHVSAPAPTESDLRLAEALARGAHGPRLQVRWLAGGDVDIQASAWVGVVRFAAWDLHVKPKAGSLRLLKMLEYTGGARFIRTIDNARTLQPLGDHLPDLICRLLADEAALLLRKGLLRNYRPDEDELPVLRGRLDLRAQTLRRYGQVDKLHCSFDEYDTDNADNQLICEALAVAHSIAGEPNLRGDLLRLRAVYSEACSPPSREANWYRRHITYGRLNERYRSAHALACLVLEHAAFEDLYDMRGNVGMRSFLLNMNSLFEDFITRLLSEALVGTDLQVAPKERFKTAIIDSVTSRPYATIVPDLVVTQRHSDGRPETRTPIDIKYKLYDNFTLSTADIYQAFTYALALSGGGVDARAGIIYPGARTAITNRLDINPSASPTPARITAASLGIEEILDEVQIGAPLGASLQRGIIAAIRAIACEGLLATRAESFAR